VPARTLALIELLLAGLEELTWRTVDVRQAPNF
jgi:hypothetical protein